MEEGLSMSLVGNTCSVPILRPPARITACSDTSAVANTSTGRFNKVIRSEEKQGGH
jgi:uncharacterized heparinase superfamily protein